jgi:hypothetical protein
MRCSDIARELNEIFLRHDLLQYRTFGYGHSFGTLSHYYGREAGWSCARTSTRCWNRAWWCRSSR